jgi:hypothetical protein
MPQPGGRAVTLHRRHRMVRQMLHEYATAVSTAGYANRSRRLIKCTKESGHFLHLQSIVQPCDCGLLSRQGVPPHNRQYVRSAHYGEVRDFFPGNRRGRGTRGAGMLRDLTPTTPRRTPLMSNSRLCPRAGCYTRSSPRLVLTPRSTSTIFFTRPGADISTT